ncbi:hypothetical protein F4801DRAFT_595055 [Xylaria longipes]|nr:hypothetical protein F4801DRAFT_595055 [Xylaria longipes]
MATFGNRVDLLSAVNFVESHFPNGQAPKPTCPGGVSNPAHSHPPQHGYLPPPPGVPADSSYYSGLPNGPPPGLVRVSPSTPAPLHVITNDNASLFGDFARYLDHGIDDEGNPVIVDLTCGICMESKLKVSNCITANGSRHAGPFEDLVVMPCGHFMGGECLYQWLLSTEGAPSCPLCRFELRYSNCGHGLDPREYDPLRFRRESIPLTFPEGGLVPNCCEYCYEERINSTVNTLRHLLFPPDVIPGDLQYADSAELLRSTSSHFRQRVLGFLIMSEHYIRW